MGPAKTSAVTRAWELSLWTVRRLAVWDIRSRWARLLLIWRFFYGRGLGACSSHTTALRPTSCTHPSNWVAILGQPGWSQRYSISCSSRPSASVKPVLIVTWGIENPSHPDACIILRMEGCCASSCGDPGVNSRHRKKGRRSIFRSNAILIPSGRRSGIPSPLFVASGKMTSTRRPKLTATAS